MAITPTSREALAIDGGTPVRKTLLPYGRQSIDDDDIQAVVDVLRSDWLTTGPRSTSSKKHSPRGWERNMRSRFSSGTAALHGAAFAAGLEAWRRSHHFAADLRRDRELRALSGRATQSLPTFAPDTLNLDPEKFADAHHDEHASSSARSTTPAIPPIWTRSWNSPIGMA